MIKMSENSTYDLPHTSERTIYRTRANARSTAHERPHDLPHTSERNNHNTTDVERSALCDIVNIII